MIDWDTIEYLLEWASLLNWESGSLLVTISGLLARLQRGSVSFRGGLGFQLHFCGLQAGSCTCRLGQTQKCAMLLVSYIGFKIVQAITWEMTYS